MSNIVPFAAPGQAAVPGVVPSVTALAGAPSVLPLGGTTNGAGTPATATDVIPIATPAPAVTPGAIPVAAPVQPEAPALAPVATPEGQNLPSLVTQEQLASAVSAIHATIAAGAKPVVTKPDGSKVELTLDENNTLSEEPIPEA